MENISQIFHQPNVAAVRRLFYVVTPAETSFATLKEVPGWVDQAIPYFLVAVVLECVTQWLQGKPLLPRLNDAYSSVSAGIMSLFPLVLARSIEISTYTWVFQQYHVTDLPWQSPWTWWLGFLGVDLGYYWLHRMSHEVNFMWAAHQAHHSSEEYNLSTALRQSVLQRYSSWVFYMPMALFVPPSIFLVHIQFNLLYQFWIHTEVIRSLGPLEYILNTPSHHRVHHGRNRYCIDKNYGGTLIIWDRLFGTFEAEKDEETVVYGLVHPLNSWNPFYIQLCHWQYILQKAWQTRGLSNKLSVVFKGPGWEPGKPRTGLLEDIPQVSAPVDKYDVDLPLWGTVYAWTHFALTVLSYLYLVLHKSTLSQPIILVCILFLVWTLTNIGLLYEHKWYSPALELVRCLVFLVVDSYICHHNEACPVALYGLRYLFLLSSVIWGLQCTRLFNSKALKID